MEKVTRSAGAVSSALASGEMRYTALALLIMLLTALVIVTPMGETRP